MCAARSYNPTPFPIGNSIEDTLEYYNMRKNPNSQPMIFKRPPIVVIRDTPVQNVERLYGGNMKMLEMDAKEPMRRPSGFVEPHSSGSKKYISNGNSASYPVFNAVEQKAIDEKKGGLVRLETKPRPMPIPTIDKAIYHPNDPNLKLVGNGLWQDMNKWGKQNEINAKKLLADPTINAIINNPQVQQLANKGKDLALAEIKKKVGGGRGRGRPRKVVMEGEGVWEDMNAWGKRNEEGFKKAYNNPVVQSVINNPVVQKLGKRALKTAVGMIPVVGSTAVQAMEMAGFGNIPRKEIVKKIMAEKGLSLIEASKYVKANGLYVAKGKSKK